MPVVLALWAIPVPPETSNPPDAPPPPPPQQQPPLGLSLALFGFLALSRLGVWVFDLATQQVTQTLVPAASRSGFAGVEAAVANAFDLLGAASAVAFPRPRQFRALAAASWAVVAVAWAMDARWVRARRGHLAHWDRAAALLCGKGIR